MSLLISTLARINGTNIGLCSQCLIPWLFIVAGWPEINEHQWHNPEAMNIIFPIQRSGYVIPVETPPPDDTWHAFLSGSAPSGFPQEDTWRASPIRTSSGRSTRHSQTSHPDDRHITSGQPTYPIRICLSGSLTKVSKSYYIIPTACHNPRSATYKAK